MQAFILAGGEGTRLRPLTSTVPKPVVPLVDRPFIAFMLDWLRRHGVDDVVMGCGHMAEGVRDVLGDGSAYGVRLRFVEEPEPLGTGGALKFAEELLDERFLMLNGDVLSDMDLGAQIAQHERAGARVTLGLVRVEDPSAYGLVRVDEAGGVHAFIEKPGPEHADVDTISAGAYVIEREVLGMLTRGERASIERDVFPALVGAGLHARVHEDAYWLDIGTPDRYLEGSFDILEGTVATPVAERMSDAGLCVAPDADAAGRVVGPVIVEPGCVVAETARVGGRAILQRGVTVGEHSVVERSVVLAGTEIGSNCVIRGCIVGGGVRIGDGAHVEGLAVLGEGVQVGAGNELAHGIRVFPGVTLPDGAVRFQ